MTVLILAAEGDEHAAAVLAEIGRGSEAQILDLSAFPESVALTMRYDDCESCEPRRFAIRRDDQSLDLAGVGAIWWRRPQQPTISPAISRVGHRNFAMNECQEALAGL